MKDIGKTLSEYRKAAGFSQIEVAKLLTEQGLETGNKSVSSWEKGVALPNAVQFLSLCKIYGITDIYSGFIAPNPDNPLSGLNDEGRDKAMDYIDLLKDSKKYSSAPVISMKDFKASKKSTPKNTRSIRVYELPASAGTGEFLDNGYYEMTEITDSVPKNAGFGVRIHGDSMLPRYTDGQIVWVDPTTELRSGEIGIFYLDGDAYCKKIEKKGNKLSLISLNKKYAPIQISEGSDFRIFGRVLN